MKIEYGIQIPVGYRQLSPGEVVKEGDLFGGEGWSEWQTTDRMGQVAGDYNVYIRKLDNDGVTCNKCHNYMPGHATGAGDICTCH